MPPNFDDLPEPVDEKNSAEELEEDIDIEKIIGIFDDDENQQSSETSSIESNEQFVLDNINID